MVLINHAHPDKDRDELIALRDRMMAIRDTRKRLDIPVKLFLERLKTEGISIPQRSYYDCEHRINRGVNLMIRVPAFAETAERILGIEYVG